MKKGHFHTVICIGASQISLMTGANLKIASHIRSGMGINMEDDRLVISPVKLRGEDRYKVISARVDTQMLLQLDSIAKETGRSRNELIGMFLEYALKHYIIKNDEIN